MAQKKAATEKLEALGGTPSVHTAHTATRFLRAQQTVLWRGGRTAGLSPGVAAFVSCFTRPQKQAWGTAKQANQAELRRDCRAEARRGNLDAETSVITEQTRENVQSNSASILQRDETRDGAFFVGNFRSPVRRPQRKRWRRSLTWQVLVVCVPPQRFWAHGARELAGVSSEALDKWVPIQLRFLPSVRTHPVQKRARGVAT